MSTVNLTLYTRVDCHLCDDMKSALVQLQQSHNFLLNIVDVDSDSYLALRYGNKVPVLVASEHELCHYHLDRDTVLKYLDTPAQ